MIPCFETSSAVVNALCPFFSESVVGDMINMKWQADRDAIVEHCPYFSGLSVWVLGALICLTFVDQSWAVWVGTERTEEEEERLSRE